MIDSLAQLLSANELNPEIFAAVTDGRDIYHATVPAGTRVMDKWAPQTEAQAMKLAAEQWIYSDDIVGQGTRSVRKLAMEIWKSRIWFFWWD